MVRNTGCPIFRGYVVGVTNPMNECPDQPSLAWCSRPEPNHPPTQHTVR